MEYVQIVINQIQDINGVKNVMLNGFNRILLIGLVKMILLTNLFKNLN